MALKAESISRKAWERRSVTSAQEGGEADGARVKEAAPGEV